MIDLFMSLAEAMAPASTPPPVPSSPPAISRPVADKPPVLPPLATSTGPIAPTKYRLADAAGATWEHADPAWLQTWITARNAALVASRPSPPQVFSYPAATARTCGPSGCR